MANSLTLNGNYYLTTPISVAMPNLTIEMWVKILDLSKNNNIIGKGLTSSDTWDELLINTVPNGGLYIDTSGTQSNQCIQISNVISANQWMYIALTKASDSKLNVYINGILKTSATISTITNGMPILIGRTNRGTTCNCLIDEIRLWNITRSSQDIQLNYNRVLKGTESGLVFYYNFDKDANGSTIVNDLSINKNNASSSGNIILSDDYPNLICNKFLIQDGTKEKYTDGISLSYYKDSPYSDSDFISVGMNDLSKINPDIIQKMDNQKYKIALYKR